MRASFAEWVALGATGAIVTASFSAACVGDDPSPASPHNGDDAGAGVIIGAPGQASLSIDAPSGRIWLVQGETLPIEVKVSRGSATTGAVLITASGLPPGVTASDVTMPPGETSANLTLSSAPDVAQGPVPVTLTAVSGDLKVDARVELFVRGKPGDMDTTFGVQGVVTSTLGTLRRERTLNLMVDATDRIYVAEMCSVSGPTSDIYACILRFDANGRADVSYGTTGLASRKMGAPAFAAVYADGKIAVAGAASDNGVTSALRFDPQGAPDATFANGGFARVYATAGAVLEAQAVAVRPNGGLVLSFRFVKDDPSGKVGLAFLDANGTQVPTFGAALGGVAWGTWDPAASVGSSGLVVRPSGSVLVTGGSSSYTFGALQVDTAGAYDGTFNGSGSGPGVGRLAFMPSNGVSGPFGVAVLSDGSVVVAVTDKTNTQTGGAVKIRADGTVDATFGASGYVALGDSGSDAVAESADSVLVASAGIDPTNHPAHVFRLSAQGALMPSFGTNGAARLDTAGLTRLALQKDGRIIVLSETLDNKVRVFRLWN